TTPVKVNTRIISATNKNLEEEIEKGRFREDLFYRIQAVTIYLPPLRERREDIPLLIDHFINKYKFEIGGNQKRFSPEALELLVNYEWPGNVRELENVVRACLVLSEGEVIHKDILPPKIREKEIKSKSMETIKELLKEKEREYIIKILHQTKGNVTKASKIAGISRRHFYKKLKDLNINPRHWREKKE
ncbi:MAG TPA: sigma-54-dependent Fis family transcriptional regulator, partial [bacterium]|nr:sigma-54-dependent Fis family transcriptional regulator [bacterium]HEX68560.1 sigma-54-dependent Fis family transcriptional regulator [bacterium]